MDWNLANNLIVSGGEDLKYKIWNHYGQQLFSSTPFDHPVTAVSWNTSGDMFAVGSYDTLKICDKLGVRKAQFMSWMEFFISYVKFFLF